MEEKIENLDSQNEEGEETPAEETPEENVARLESDNKKLYARAKKAEGFEFIEGKWIKKPKPEIIPNPKPESKVEGQSLTTKDALALVNAKVSDEDYDEVIRVSKILDKTIGETLKDKTMQSILSERVEERRTAELAQTGKNRRGEAKTTGEDLLAKAEKTGEVPDDEEGLKKLFQARLARKIKG